MKELSIEEKAKAYDRAIEELRGFLEGVHEEKCEIMEEDIIKIFPELKESEDESMMNQLHSWMKEFGGAEEYTEKVYLWLKGLLEKQGKQKETLCDKCKKTQPSHSCQDITALGRCALEKQGEQKRTKFERAVKQVMEEAIECGDTHNLKADAEMLLSLVHNSSWSEEDDIMKQNCHQMLALLRPNSSELIKDIIDNCHHWLKSLKNRVQPQSTWKPSDEQIKVLVEVLIFAANHESPHWNDYIFGILKNLTRQLKKLREE